MNDAGHARLGSLPCADGLAARFAEVRARAAGIDVAPLLREAGLTSRQIEEPGARGSARGQIRFLALVAAALGDDLLGFHLAQAFDLRAAGLIYYVMASSDRLGSALSRGRRYTRIANEALSVDCRAGTELTIAFDLVGVARHSDRHQLELWLTTLVRLCRQLTDRRLLPVRVRMVHRREAAAPELDRFFGCRVEFGADSDEIAFAGEAAQLPIVSADPYLHDILIAYADEVLARRRIGEGALRQRVENAVAPLLPHGNARIQDIASQLGMSPRTLARRLAAEGASFATVVDELRRDLARRYLSERELSISKVAWLLGYQEASAFTHAFKRWTGETPSRLRARTVEAGAAPPGAA